VRAGTRPANLGGYLPVVQQQFAVRSYHGCGIVEYTGCGIDFRITKNNIAARFRSNSSKLPYRDSLHAFSTRRNLFRRTEAISADCQFSIDNNAGTGKSCLTVQPHKLLTVMLRIGIPYIKMYKRNVQSFHLSANPNAHDVVMKSRKSLQLGPHDTASSPAW